MYGVYVRHDAPVIDIAAAQNIDLYLITERSQSLEILPILHHDIATIPDRQVRLLAILLNIRCAFSDYKIPIAIY